MVDLENRAKERHSTNQQGIGEHDGGEFDGQEAVGLEVKRVRDDPEDDFTHDGESAEDDDQEVDCGGGKMAGVRS